MNAVVLLAKLTTSSLAYVGHMYLLVDILYIPDIREINNKCWTVRIDKSVFILFYQLKVSRIKLR